MGWEFTAYAAALFLTSGCASLLALYVWRRKEAPARGYFVLLMLAVIAWAFARGCEAVALETSDKLFWAKIEYFGISSVPLSWFLFASAYCHKSTWLQPRKIILLSIIPIISVDMAFTNGIHYLLWSNITEQVTHNNLISARVILVYQHGVWFWVVLAFSYLMMIVGTYWLIQAAFRSAHLYRRQVIAVSLAALFPWVGNVIYVLGWSPLTVDLTPFAFTLAGILIVWGIFRLQLLDLVPVARDVLVENMTDGILVLDSQDRIIDFNPAAQHLMSANLMIGKPLEYALPNWSTLLNQSVEANSEVFINERYLDIRVTPIYDRQGRFTGRLVVGRDITARKGVEQEFNNLKSMLNAAFAQSPVPMVLATAPNNVIQIYNEACKELLGISDEHDYTGRSLNELNPDWENYLPDGTPISFEEMPIGLALRGKATTSQEYRIVRKDGTERWIIVNGTPIYNEEDELIGGMIVFPDITTIKQTETALQRNIENLTVLHQIEGELNRSLSLKNVFTFGMDAVIRSSRAGSGLIALLNEDVFDTIEAFGGYVSKRDSDFDTGVMGRALRKRQPILVEDVSTDPDYVPVLEQTRAQIVIPLIYHHQLIGVLNIETPNDGYFTRQVFEFEQLIAARITAAIENARLYELAQSQVKELTRLYAQVKELERLKTDMIRLAAHDIRNPLGVIMGNAQLLDDARNRMSDQEKESLDAILSASNRIKNITQEILSVKRIEEAQRGETETMLDLKTLVQSAFEKNQLAADRKAQQFELALPEDAIMVKGDSAQLLEALDNLINNAIKYTPPKGTIQVCLLQGTHGQAIFEVEDSGYGVPENQQAKLFQPFYRVNMRETKEIEGTGLGLHLVKNIIERHHGRMRFRSTYGKGSTFGFELMPGR